MDDDEVGVDTDSAIAIVGLACRFPGARTADEFWTNLANGVESVRFYSDEELLAAGESPAALKNPDYVRAQPELTNFDKFDAGFWGFSPRDAAVTDPAHRLFLEVAYESLENAGHRGIDEETRVGVFATSGASLYWMQNLQGNQELMDEMGEFLVRHTGNDTSFMATRLSYELDFKGPSINVQAACSSALVAVHYAAQSLLSGECDLAIAGASTVLLPQKRGYLYKQGEIMSPDGHCRPFDANSAGTVFGSGAGAVVLRRLSDAQNDGDTVYAILRGSAVNNDGSQKVGFLAPGVEGQTEVIAEALSVSGLESDAVSYVEAHGTGTLVGDPIEFEALNAVFQDSEDRQNPCLIGSVKSNIGHLGEAAGISSLIKVVMAMRHRQLPPTINFESPNPEMDIQSSQFAICDQLTEWQPIQGRLVAGITGLGAGGTNAHILLEAPPEVVSDPVVQDDTSQLLLLSAKSQGALRQARSNLAQTLRRTDAPSLADVSFTLQAGRREYPHRFAIACRNNADAIELLEQSEESALQGAATEKPLRVIYMFPGGGAQYATMGKELYQQQPAYQTAFDACMDCLNPSFADEIRSLLFSDLLAPEEAAKTLARPSRSLVALFATEYSLAALYRDWGIVPEAMIGHSMGENTAACIAGVIDLPDAMRLVEMRGKLFEQAPQGAMLSVNLLVEQLKELVANGVGNRVDIAAVNAPELCVASGSIGDIENLQEQLQKQDIDCTRIHIDVAAHSRMLEPILEEFRVVCRSLSFSTPKIPFTSNVSGTWITDEQATDPDYWVTHLRSTVRFSDNIATVSMDGAPLLVEIGPGQTLTSLARACGLSVGTTFKTMRRHQEQMSDVQVALQTLGLLWANGAVPDWEQYWGDENHNRVELPSYAFQRKKYWVDPVVGSTQEPVSAQSLARRDNPDDWFAQYAWVQAGDPRRNDSIPGNWLLFIDGDNDSSTNATKNLVPLLAEKIEQAGHTNRIITVAPGKKFGQIGDDQYELDPNDPDQFDTLFAALSNREITPDHVVYTWSMVAVETQRIDQILDIEAAKQLALYSFWGLFNLAKALCQYDSEIRLTVASTDQQSFGSEVCQPAQALVMGPVGVLPREAENILTRAVDFGSNDIAEPGSSWGEQLVEELLAEQDHRFVAWRNEERWTREIRPTWLPETSADGVKWIRENGTYLISGGLGGIGLTISKHLARGGAGRLVLLGRSKLPARSEWGAWLDNHSNEDQAAWKIRQVLGIEELGVVVDLIAVDVSDVEALRTALVNVHDIRGVIHAAGTMDDQPLMIKSVDSVKAVMEAKIYGALALNQVVAPENLDFFVVFSSVAAQLGLPGQLDYTAANAFLDAFARARNAITPGYSVAINWNAWRDQGMAAKAARTGAGAGEFLPLLGRAHPLLDGCLSRNDLSAHYQTSYSASRDWLLAEHRVKGGECLIPGTGFVETIRAAYSEFIVGAFNELNQQIVLSDIQFIAPFQVSDDQARSLNVFVECTDKNSKSCEIALFVDAKDSPYVTATAKLLPSANRPERDIDAARKRCSQSGVTRSGFLDQDFMDFGPRWGCIASICFNRESAEALIDIELPERFGGDLDQLLLHPAALDMATGGAQLLIEGFDQGKDFYVPIVYQRLELFAPMPQRFSSHVRYQTPTGSAFAHFDIDLIDAQGELFCAISGFTMKRVEQSSLFAANENTVNIDETGIDDSLQSLESILKNAIRPAEGVAAFDRVMSVQKHPQWIISSVDVAAWKRQLDDNLHSTNSGLVYEHEDFWDPDRDADIEPIEGCIAGMSAVNAVAVRCFLGETGEKRLVAFIEAPASSPSLTLDAVNDLLDLYSLQGVEVVDVLPRGEGGEVDRLKLTDPHAPEDLFAAPSTPTEIRLAELWSTTLGTNRVEVTANFYELGGHSLLLTRLLGKVQREFSRKIDLEKAYETPTIQAWGLLLDANTEVVEVKSIRRIDRSKYKV